ncbi:MAG: PilZ domain-containing protein [Lachnospiraceae bacterium]|nr:PilZ domain-containing protein [Lachnospiraceae bacterium]
MDLSKVRVGSLLEIYIKRDGYNYRVVSKVEYVDDKMIGVSPIASRTQLFKFRDNDTVDVVCKQDSDTWKFANVIPGYTVLEDGTKLHTFTPHRKAESFNRRMAFRLDMNVEITISYEKHLFKEALEEALNGTKPELERNDKDDLDRTLDEALDRISERYCELTAKAFLKDISEGGAAISSDAILEKGDVVTFSFRLAFEEVSCRAVVVRIKKNDEKEFFANYYGLSFVETSHNFIKAFFAEQRKAINRSKVNVQFK